MKVNELKKAVNKELKEMRTIGINVPEGAFKKANNDVYMKEYANNSISVSELANLLINLS